MKTTMSMSIDTTWGNRVTLSVESELDNPHDLTIGELTRLQVWTLSLMVHEVRAENERSVALNEPPSENDLGRERERYAQMERDRDS